MSTDFEAIKGTLIDGRYEIRERLGQGGMGIVFRALDKKLNQTVALKMLLHSTGSERSKEERRRRFMHEIYAINEVEHRNVVHIQEFGFYRDTPYMVMELLKGKDLNRILKGSAELLPIEYCVDVMLIVSAAIQACHDRGVIHRDLKPGNIMVIESDSGHGWDVKVVDFSISKVASDLTKDGQIVGTPNYLSPEQVSGKVVPASDQYALGLLLYVCLTNRHPFEELDGLPLIRAIERGEVKNPRAMRPDIPEALERVIMKAMNLDPAQRFRNVREFGQKIWPFASDLGKGVWKKYYFETPIELKPRMDAKRSTTGIPLVLQIAQGKVPMTAATALAHYQSTTAVRVGTGTTTMDDPDARAAAEGDPGAPTGSVRTLDDPDARPFVPAAPSAPSGWRWKDSSSQSKALSASSDHAEGTKPRSRRMVVIGVGLGLSLLAMLLVGRSLREGPGAAPHSPAVEERAVPVTPAVPSPSTVHPAAPEPVGGQPIKKVEPASTAPATASVPATTADDRLIPSKRADRTRRRKAPKAADWTTDPSGNPIPPM